MITKVNIEHLLEIREELHLINKTPLEQIELYRNGSLISLPIEEMERLLDAGLNNTDVILWSLGVSLINRGLED